MKSGVSLVFYFVISDLHPVDVFYTKVEEQRMFIHFFESVFFVELPMRKFEIEQFRLNDLASLCFVDPSFLPFPLLKTQLYYFVNLLSFPLETTFPIKIIVIHWI